MIPIVYYAHSITIYGADQERHELSILESFFYDSLIYNPNRPSIQMARDPMAACFEIVKDPSVTDLAFSLNEGRFISLGVFAEIRAAQKKGIPVYVVNNYSVRPFNDEFHMVKLSKKEKWAEVKV